MSEKEMVSLPVFDLLNQKVLHHKLDVVRVFLQHRPEEGLKPRAVGSLVVGKDGDGDGCVFGPL